MIQVVVDPSEIEAAQGRLERAIDRWSEQDETLLLGYQGGSKPAHVRWLRDAGFWVSFEREPNRFWNAFGLGNPFEQRQPISIAVQINPPRTGIDRKVQGAFGKTEDGETLLLHRGGIGGSKPEIGKSNFLEFYSNKRVLWPVYDGTKAGAAIIVGALSDPTLPSQLAAFVQNVARFKASVTGGTRSSGVDSDPFTPEYEGLKEMPPRERIIAECRHGAIVNELQRVLDDLGCLTGSDQLRDLVLRDEIDNARVVFEIKPVADRYAVYTAVGQLLVNNNDQGVRRIPVFPADLNEDLRKSMTDLGLQPVLFRWEGPRPVFIGLKDVID